MSSILAKINKWRLFTDDERESIIAAYDKVTQSGKKKSQLDTRLIRKAGLGVYIRYHNEKSISIYERLMEIKKNNKYPIAHEDSMNAWANRAVNFFGLTVGDILKMKFGEKMEVIFFDRNVGDYTDDFRNGRIYDPKKQGLSCATYIHASGISGVLRFNNYGSVIHDNFEWELNLSAIGSKNYFWGPLCLINANKSKIEKINPNILVGWRGPSIKMSDAEKYLPSSVKHYGTEWNDSLYFQYSDFLRKK